MTGTPSILVDLLAQCDALGIRLIPVGEGGLTIDAPQHALTPDLLQRLKSNKTDVLAILQRPEALPCCRLCGGQLNAIPTFDGFENAECPRCGRSFGCIPATRETIERFGERTWTDVLHAKISFSRIV